MNVWDSSPLPPPDDGAQAATDGAVSSGGDAGGPPEPPTPGDSEPEPGDESALTRRIAGVPAWLLLVLAVVIWIGVIAALILPIGDDSPASDIAGDRPAAAVPPPPPPPSPTAPAVVITSPTETTAPATSTPATTDAAVTTAPPTAPPTTAPPTTVAATTTVPTTTVATTVATTVPTTTVATTVPTTTVPTTTVAPSTTAMPSDEQSGSATISEPSTVTGDDGRSLTVVPRRDACRYGPECLVVAFTIDAFPTQPGEFVCEFSSGARYVFKFSRPGVDPACSTLDIPDSVVVEVGGLRSEPATIGN